MTRPQLARTLIVLATIVTVIAIGGILIDRAQTRSRQHDTSCMLYGGPGC
jgi:hypothetical protein